MVITLVSGGVGSGKSTQAELIATKLASHKDKYGVVWIDSSLCLENSRKSRTETGLKLLQEAKRQSEGFLTDPRLVVESIMENLRWLQSIHHGTEHFLVPGGGRAIPEIKEWERLLPEGISFRVVFIECTEKQTWEGIKRRIDQDILRADQGEAEMENRLLEYRTKTVPMLDYLRKNRPELLACTSRSKPARERTIDTIKHMEIPACILERWMGRINTDTHPIQQDFAELDGRPMKKEETWDEFMRRTARFSSQGRKAPRFAAEAA